MKDLGHIIEEAAPPEPEKKNDTPPIVEAPPVKAEEKKTPPAKPDEAPPAAKVIPKAEQDKSLSDTVREIVNTSLSEREQRKPDAAPAATTPKPTDAPPATKDDFEATLDDLEKDELELRRFAEKVNPDKYKGSADEYVASLKRLNTYIETSRKENPDRTFDENDEDFEEYVKKNIPNFSVVERRRIERQLITADAREQAKRDMQVEQEDIKRKQRMLEVKPEIERSVSDFVGTVNGVMKQPLAEGKESVVLPIVERAQEVGWKQAIAEDPIHAPVVKTIQDAAVRRAGEYLALVEGVKDFRPLAEELPMEHPRNDHAWLLNFIRRQGEWLDKNGGDMRTRTLEDGTQQTFVPMHVWGEISQKEPQKARQHWTFSIPDVLDMLAHNARVEAEVIVKKEVERMEAAGYQRVKKKDTKNEIPKAETQTKRTTGEPKESGAPKATASVSPGAGSSVVPHPQGAFSAAELKSLGF